VHSPPATAQAQQQLLHEHRPFWQPNCYPL